MTDQFGNAVPDDLVILDLQPCDLTEDQLKAIDDLDWFQPGFMDHHEWVNVILVSEAELAASIHDDTIGDCTWPRDVGLDLKSVDYIGRILHRWEPERFYHA